MFPSLEGKQKRFVFFRLWFYQNFPFSHSKFVRESNEKFSKHFVQYYSRNSFWKIIPHMCLIRQNLFLKKTIKVKNRIFPIR